MKKLLLITGANGQVATEYQLSNPLDDWEHVFLSKENLDITSQEQVDEVLNIWEFDAVLNLAAYTNVELAERETEKTFQINSVGPLNLARACKSKNIPLIHFSTDYVFDGQLDFFTEEDTENPLNQYGRTKFLGEKWIQENHDWYYIIRVSWVYSNQSQNFFSTMMKLSQERSEVSIIDDQTGSPTSAKEICRAIDAILDNLDKPSGIYHFSGLGKTSWKNFAEEIFKQCNVTVKVIGIPTSAWPSKVIRPKNSYLTSEKFSKTFKYSPMYWKDALFEIIKERKVLPVKVGDRVMLNGEFHLIVSTDWAKRLARISLETNLEESIEISFDLLRLKNE
jgi:dTDP-4-dehydrorhamnose reductase